MRHFTWVWLVLLLALSAPDSRAGCPERAYNGAIRLPDGRVLTVGFAAGCIYDPRTRAWMRTGALLTPRREAQLAVLADGSVLLVGGRTDKLGILDWEGAARAEVLTPATGQWSDGGELPAELLRGHAVFALNDGRAFAVGESAQLFDPVFRTWQRAFNAGSYRFSAAVLLGERRVFMLAGETEVRYAEPVTVYDGPAMTPSADSMMLTVPARIADEERLGVRPGPDLGTSSAGVTRLLDAALRQDESIAMDWQRGPRLRQRRSNHSATLLPDGSILVAGGVNGPGDERTPLARKEALAPDRSSVIRSAERWLPAQDLFTPAAPMTEPRALHTAVLLPDGRVLVLGGLRNILGGGTPLRTVEAYEPMQNRWQRLRPLMHSHIFPSAVVLSTDAVLVVGLGSMPEVYRLPPR